MSLPKPSEAASCPPMMEPAPIVRPVTLRLVQAAEYPQRRLRRRLKLQPLNFNRGFVGILLDDVLNIFPPRQDPTAVESGHPGR